MRAVFQRALLSLLLIVVSAVTADDSHAIHLRLRSGGTPPVGGGYDLAAKLAALPFAVTQPTAPTLTSTCTASTSGELTTCLGTNGADITITANITGSFSSSALDQRITINSGVSLSSVSGTSQTNATPLNLGSAARRIHIRGPGTIAGAFYTVAAVQDVRLDSDLKITTRTDSTTGAWDAVHLQGTRVLVERVTITTRGYASYSVASVDLIIANSLLSTSIGCGAQCNDSTIRHVGCTRCVVIDSNVINYSHHSLRAHYSVTNSLKSSNVYWARNQLQGDADDDFGGAVLVDDSPSPGNNPQCDTCWFVDNQSYGVQVKIDASPENEAWTITGNRIYSNVGSANFNLGCGAGWTCSDNVKNGYGSGPPAWNFQ